MRVQHLIDELSKLDPETLLFSQESKKGKHHVLWTRDESGEPKATWLVTIQTACNISEEEETEMMIGLHNYKV